VSLLVGIPVISAPRRDVLAGWNYPGPHFVAINGAFDDWANILIGRPHWHTAARPDDEPRRNLGVAASWNRFFVLAREFGYSHVALMSQGVILDGGTERLAELVDEFADWRGLLTDFAYRCIVFGVKVWEQVGGFNEDYWPGYYEDSEFTRLLFLAGLHSPGNPMPKVGRDLLDGTATEAAALTGGLIDPACYGRNGALYRERWGGDPFKESFDRAGDPGSYNPGNCWSRFERPVP
jgi:hypothetical protein